MSTGRMIICARCGRGPTRHDGHGWCTACADRWRYHGRPESGPPPPAPRGVHLHDPAVRARARATLAARRAARVEDFSDLRGFGLSVAEAAARVGVTLRTGWRYEAERRHQTRDQQEDQEAAA